MRFLFYICTCSAQLSMFHMEKRSRNTLITIIIIIIITIKMATEIVATLPGARYCGLGVTIDRPGVSTL